MIWFKSVKIELKNPTPIEKIKNKMRKSLFFISLIKSFLMISASLMLESFFAWLSLES